MITIKDVAKHAGTSPSTVSIVLKGNGNTRKISEATQNRVFKAVRELGYTPNIQAKVLRNGLDSSLYITLFWASDIRVHMLSRFLNGLQESLILHNYPCEIQIKPYKNNFLKETMSERTLLGCNGVIVCNASETDMDFLENTNIINPIVLYNRYSSKYSTVNMDDKTIGTIPAQIFAKHNKKMPAVIKAPATFNGMNIRTNMFDYQLGKEGIQYPVTFTVNDSMKGGYEGAKKILGLTNLPDCVFCTSDNIAIGALKAFHTYGIKIPEQIEIISIGNGNTDQQEYAIPSLSVVNLPMEEMAHECLKIIFNILNNSDYTIISKEFPIEYIARESCPK